MIKKVFDSSVSPFSGYLSAWICLLFTYSAVLSNTQITIFSSSPSSFFVFPPDTNITSVAPASLKSLYNCVAIAVVGNAITIFSVLVFSKKSISPPSFRSHNLMSIVVFPAPAGAVSTFLSLIMSIFLMNGNASPSGSVMY